LKKLNGIYPEFILKLYRSYSEGISDGRVVMTLKELVKKCCRSQAMLSVLPFYLGDPVFTGNFLEGNLS
jgi:hypothetical protein